MFGYVRPVRDKLSEDEYLLFRSVYCGLCHSIGRRCGAFARFSINYDFTFLAMLFSKSRNACFQEKRCMAHPFKKRRCLVSDPAMDKAADYSVILSWWKLRDTSADSGFFKAAAARMAALCLRRGFKKAARREPGFAEAVEEHIKGLSGLEKESCRSIDRTADRFALILAAAAQAEPDDARKRVLEQLLYHTGRLVYIMDAVDDLPEDFKKKTYNPIIYRYALTGPALSAEALLELERTQRHSINLVASAFQLLEEGPWTDILTNIIYLGLPAMGAKLLQKYMQGDASQPSPDKFKDGDTI